MVKSLSMVKEAMGNGPNWRRHVPPVLFLLGMALMLGLLGLPHILMRFYTVPDAKAARTSVLYATGFIGYFYIIIPIVGFGSSVLVGRQLITQIDKGGNMTSPLLAEFLGGTAFLGFISAVAFATILAVVAGLTLAGASAYSHDIYVSVIKKGNATEEEQVRTAKITTVVFGLFAVLLGILFKGQNVAYMVGLTFAVGTFVLVSFALVLVGPRLAGPIANWLGLGAAFEAAWRIIQWPIVFFLIATAISMIYYFGPDAEQRWEWITPGSLVATVLWILVSLGFRFYLSAFGNFNATYGAIGGVIIAMLWLYISGLAILVGAELNAEIEHASPWGKKKGEKRPGERVKIGRAAAAAWEEGQTAGGEGREAELVRLPRPDRLLPAPAGPPRRRVSDRVRLSDWVLGGAAIAAELALAVRSVRRRVKG